MKWNLRNPKEADQAFAYLTELVGKEALVEIRRNYPVRTLNQNAYLHLILSAFADNFGYTADEAKQVYKEVNANIYRYDKKGRTFWRSSADLTKDEMAKSIDIFRLKSAEQGYDLPLATDQEWLRSLANKVEQSRYI